MIFILQNWWGYFATGTTSIVVWQGTCLLLFLSRVMILLVKLRMLWRAIIFIACYWKRRLFLWIRLRWLLWRAVWRIFVKDIEFLASTNSLNFILSGRGSLVLSRCPYHPIPMLRPKVINSIVPIWYFAKGKLANSNVLPGASFIFTNRHSVLSQ